MAIKLEVRLMAADLPVSNSGPGGEVRPAGSAALSADTTRPKNGADAPHTLPPDDPARKAYETAQAAYQKELTAYWSSVDKAKQSNQKVTSFPPFYAGPEKPPGYDPPKEPSTLPTVNDMLAAWKQLAPMATGNKDHPDLPSLQIQETSESNFKKAYARESLVVGRKHGLSDHDTENIVESIYAFEDAGQGTADLLSGVPFRLTAPDAPGTDANKEARRNIHPLSTAIGYNQLLMATSLQFVDSSNAISKRLDDLAKTEPDRAAALHNKEHLLEDVKSTVHGELMKFAQTNAHKYLDGGKLTYAAYTDFAKSSIRTDLGMTGRQLTSAVQAMNLDKDIGPVLQAQELEELFSHGLDPSFKGLLDQKARDSAGALTAFGRLSDATKSGAIDNLLDRVDPGSDAAKTALRNKLLEFSRDENIPLTPDSLGRAAYDLLVSKVLPAKKYGDKAGPLNAAARLMIDALFEKVENHPAGDGYLPAAVELGNLAGTANADEMLQTQNADYSTVNFFDRSGYQSNGVTNGRTADELLKAIYRNMHGANSSPTNYGMGEMIKAFKAQSQ
jgi:hypothetical protein